MSFSVGLPVFIPSLFRNTLRKNKNHPIIKDCLDDLFINYDAKIVHVFAQEFPDEWKEKLVIEYPSVTWHWLDTRLGVPGTFEEMRKYSIIHYDAYIHMDDDVILTSSMKENPTLSALEHFYRLMPNRAGLVSCANTSISHFRRGHPKAICTYSNPAMLVLINNLFAKDCKYDLRFPKWRSDTDFTQQIAEAGGIPLIINKHFSFIHTVHMSSKKDGKFEIKMKTLSEQLTNFRDEDSRKEEFRLMESKWPLVKTTKAGHQLLLKSIEKMCQPKEEEIKLLNDNFPWHLVFKPDTKAT